MSLVRFAVSVWKGAGLLLGTGLLLYLAIAAAKTVMQELETVCEVLIVLISRFKHQTLGTHRSMKQLWNVLTTWKKPDKEPPMTAIRQARPELSRSKASAATSRTG